MDFIDKISEIRNRVSKQIDHIQTEEATKNAFVMPFINALGYDIFNPLEVIPEFTADIGTKKGEKVDYAIKKDEQIVMLIECKWCGACLSDENMSQLWRYFSATEARFGILTNGLVYQFYSDIDETNKMDSKPFFTFDITSFDEQHIAELKKFAKPSFDLDNILETASQLKYTNSIKKVFANEIAEPSDEFTRFFTGRVYSGVKTQSVVDQFKNIVRDALNQFIREKVNERLQSALNVTQVDAQDTADPQPDDSQSNGSDKSGIVTTEEEIEGFNIIKAISRAVVDLKRVHMRDTKSYCGILLDDNNRKPICRLHFNYSKKYIGLFTNKNEERIQIEDLNDIFKFTDRIQATIREYENEGA